MKEKKFDFFQSKKIKSTHSNIESENVKSESSPEIEKQVHNEWDDNGTEEDIREAKIVAPVTNEIDNTITTDADSLKEQDSPSQNESLGCTFRELVPKYDKRKSFYGKALIVISENGNIEELLSYGEVVGRMTDGKLDYADMSTSQTTRRHVREWLMQHDIDPAADKSGKVIFPPRNGDPEKMSSIERWEKFHDKENKNTDSY